MFRPGTDVREQDNPEKSQKRKPRKTRLSLGKYERGEERAERGARVAADLEERSRQAVLPAGSHACDARRFRVEHGRADADEGRGGENCAEARSHREGQQTNKCNSHSDGQGIRLGPTVGIETDEGLENGSGQLQSKGDQAHLAEIEMEGVLEKRINGGDHGLNSVIQ